MPKRSQRVNLRLSPQLVNKVKAAAKRELRSVNSMFEVIVNAWATKR